MKLTIYAPGVTVEIVNAEPPPVELPPVEPPPVGGLGALTTRQMNMSAYLVFNRTKYSLGSYTRDGDEMLGGPIVGASVSLPFHGDASPFTLRSTGYTLLCDGASVAHVGVPTPAPQRLEFTAVDLSAVADGWHLFDIKPDSGAETCLPVWLYVAKDGIVKPHTFAPAVIGTYDLTHNRGALAAWAKLPTAPTHPGHPLAPRVTEPFDVPLAPSALYRRELVPLIHGDPHHVHRTAAGVYTCLNAHAYSWANFTRKTPPHLLRDGPRGIGTLSGVTHIEVGKARPDGINLRGHVYFTDCWSFGRIDKTGRITRLIGFRHGAADGSLELVGDWSGVPEVRRGTREMWGMAWDESTLAIDDAAAPIPTENNEHPHFVGPVVFLADTQNGRILRGEFSAVSHATPAKVTEFITGIADPWDVVYHDGLLYISERFKHRIVVHDATTGAYIRTLIEQTGTYGSMWAAHRLLTRAASIDVLRQQPCIGPEGLFYQDGHIFFGSNALAQVRKVSIETGEWSVVATLPHTTTPASAQLIYAKIAVSDGTFGPRGTVFVGMWDVGRMGGPYAFTPDGKEWAHIALGEFFVNNGRGPYFAASNYSSAVGVGMGRLLYGSASYGLAEITKALPTDPPAWDHAKYKAGALEYRRAGLKLVHGPSGMSQFDYPLPWGRSENIDYYLACNGHAQP
jgi:hypothetical protein